MSGCLAITCTNILHWRVFNREARNRGRRNDGDGLCPRPEMARFTTAWPAPSRQILAAGILAHVFANSALQRSEERSFSVGS